MRLLYILVFLILSKSLNGQGLVNIVPNSGFEEYRSIPVGWFYKGRHFSAVLEHWSSPTAGSPDIYGAQILVPPKWAKKGFGEGTIHNGQSMVGITVHGCNSSKPHCREYIQIPLLEPLIAGQGYEFSMYVRRLSGGYKTQNLGVAFTHSTIYIDNINPLDVIASHSFAHSNPPNDQGWFKISGTVLADSAYANMIIGNFQKDRSSDIELIDSMNVDFSYYYIDDVLLQKVAPFIDAPEVKSSWEGVEIKPPHTFVLNNIFFDTDKSELLPRSYVELEKLNDLLVRYPNMIILISGHTDSQGGVAYNDALSMRRARAVEQYLHGKGIHTKRMSIDGHGLHKPIAPNDTAEGRQLNRRVDFTVVSM